MVPVEPISLSIGAVALATLFSTCLECFEYFEAAKSLGPDFNLLLLNFDCQRERLAIWAELAGINKTVEEGRNPLLDSLEAASSEAYSSQTDGGGLLTRCLNSIKSLCEDAGKLQNDYGVRRIDTATATVPVTSRISSSRVNLFWKSFLRIRRPINAESRPTLASKTKWAIHDKTKFETLISHIETLVNNVHNLVPVSEKAQKMMVMSDIGSLGLSNLHLVQTVCDGTARQEWSDAASAMMIIASDAGTTDLRKSKYVENWVDDAVHYEDRESSPTVNKDRTRPIKNTNGFKLGCGYGARLFFVFTERCLSMGFVPGCHRDDFGMACFEVSQESFITTSQIRTVTIGGRITETFPLKFADAELQILSLQDRTDLQEAAVQRGLPKAEVSIHCAPCACAVRTALEICRSETTEIIQYRLKVDDRLSASCCPEVSKTTRLQSMINSIKKIESTTENIDNIRTGLLTYVDRVWLENRIDKLEEYSHDESIERPPFDRAAELLAELKPRAKETGFVVLGELEHTHWILQTDPFPWKSKIPKESEMYQFNFAYKGAYIRPGERLYLGTYTPKNYRSNIDVNPKPTRPLKRQNSAADSMSIASEPVVPLPPPSKRQHLTENGVEHLQESGIGQGTAKLGSSYDFEVHSNPRSVRDVEEGL